MHHQEPDDPVWDLLKHASKVEPSPFFSRNTVREVRLEGSKTRWWESLENLFASRRAAFTMAATAAVAIGVVYFLAQPSATAPSVEMADQSIEDVFDPASELEEVEYLGQLVAVADPGQLTDDVLADLFF